MSLRPFGLTAAGASFALVAASIALPGVALATTATTWSGAVQLTSAGNPMTGRSTVLADGTVAIVTATPSDGNSNGLTFMIQSGGTFSAPAWIYNAPGSADTSRSVSARTLAVSTDGSDITVTFMTNADNGGGTFRLAGFTYIGSTQTWSSVDFEDLTVGGGDPDGDPTFVHMHNDDTMAAYADNNGDLQSAIYNHTTHAWQAVVAVGVAMDPNGYYAPNLAAATDGSVWLSYNAVNTPKAVKWSSGAWGTAESVRGATPNGDFDAGNDDISQLALVTVAGAQQPAVAYGLSGNNTTEVAIRNASGTWAAHTVNSSGIANAFMAFGVDSRGNASVAMYDYNAQDPVVISSTDSGVTWAAPVTVTVPGTNIYQSTFSANPAGDVFIALSLNLGASGSEYGEIWMVVHRAGVPGFTAPTLVSTETTVRDSQGAASIDVTFSGSSLAMPVSWISWDDDSGSNEYGLYWTDAGSLFPGPTGSAPDTPSITGLRAGIGKVSVRVARASSGSAPTGYTITAHPGGATCTVTAVSGGSCEISGLHNGRAYTFTAVASNTDGDSAPTAASSPAVPGAPVNPGPQTLPRALPAGGSYVTEDGARVPASVDPNADGNGLVLTGDGFTMNLAGLEANGTPSPLDANGVLTLTDGNQAQTSGDGFMGNSLVTLYVDPPVGTVLSKRMAPAAAIKVGTVRTDAKGAFHGRVALPADLSPGVHTLQAVGATKANLPRALSLGVRVTSRPSAVRNLSATVSRDTLVATLTWAGPVDKGGSAITGYAVRYRLLPGGTWTRDVVTGTSASFTLRSLSCTYAVQVAAINSAGHGSWSGLRIVDGRATRGDLCPLT